MNSKILYEVIRLFFILKVDKDRLLFFIAAITMPAVMPSGGAQGPSCFDRVKIGFLMGACVGMASGAIFGGFTALRYGLRGRELITQVTIHLLSSDL
jgi:hypothetical protein